MNESLAFLLGVIAIGTAVQFAIVMRRKRRNGTVDPHDHRHRARRVGRMVVLTIVVALLALALFNLVIERMGH
jgi:ABC-type Fe3+ transport system permease subunit